MSGRSAVEVGATSVCRTCNLPITYRLVERVGYLPITAWSDGFRIDEHICFRAASYQHQPPNGICRRCGCTTDPACDGGCAWAYPDICTACLDDDELDRLLRERNE